MANLIPFPEPDAEAHAHAETEPKRKLTRKGVLAYDKFHLCAVIRKRPYWGDEQPEGLLVDHHETMVRTWFENEDIIAGQTNIGRDIQAAARFNCFHPVQNYLNSLTWDGKPRIDTWLSIYLGADDSPYKVGGAAMAHSSRYEVMKKDDGNG